VHNKIGLIKVKYGTLFNALKKLYPQHQWEPLLFSNRLPSGYWQQASTVQHYHELLTEWKAMHRIRTVSDWFELPPQQFAVFKRVALGIFGSKRKMLETWFPELIWQSQFTFQLELRVRFFW
jgi:hypothetical protein